MSQLRLVLLAPMLGALCGCVTAIASRTGSDVPVEKLRDDNKSIVLLHTSLHDERCDTISATLARRDESGRYVRGDTVMLKGMMDFLQQLPSQIVLPAGEYGIVAFTCNVPYNNRVYNARVAQRGSILDGSGTIYERPLATFQVGSGEVVDIGSARLPGRTISAGLLKGVRREFIVVVTPIPEPWLNNLAASNPKLHSSRIVRPMTGAVRI